LPQGCQSLPSAGLAQPKVYVILESSEHFGRGDYAIHNVRSPVYKLKRAIVLSGKALHGI